MGPDISILLSNVTFYFSKYNVRRTTSNLKIPYHVKESFRTEFTGSMRRLESSIEEEYLHSLRQNCFREKSYSKLENDI